MTNNIIEISRQIIVNIEKLDDLVDSYFEPIKDLTETAQDIFSPIKAIHSLYTLNKKRKFKNFLKGYADSLNGFDLNNFENSERLKEYLKIERNYNFINDTIENAINSKSIYGSILLGHYAGNILSQKIKIGYKEIISIECLKELNDIELSCFVQIFSQANLAISPIHLSNLKKTNVFFCQLTIEKMIQLRVLEKNPTIYLNSKSSLPLTFVSTEIAEELFFLIEELGIYNELLNYEL